ncbi:hypothetical protein LTR56_005382 [Elasticomyces elasticus]|nr:hypothetical protein LTR22_018657 [Elasticomyces elasticus]KAK3651875.1 hypothetical protein LTR56_005382 [Elasticomyces elasticus]KAK4927770.1 hypothetical protein LTR49_005394 [Elasticomyces elasticus]KAK5761441.1 hypothetical protein LTS12_008402 [Elasticomyces elasticus]
MAGLECHIEPTRSLARSREAASQLAVQKPETVSGHEGALTFISQDNSQQTLTGVLVFGCVVGEDKNQRIYRDPKILDYSNEQGTKDRDLLRSTTSLDFALVPSAGQLVEGVDALLVREVEGLDVLEHIRIPDLLHVDAGSFYSWRE